MGQFFLGESQSRIYPHMRAKFGRSPTVVSKKKGGLWLWNCHKYVGYNTANNVSTFSMSGTILPSMCHILVVIQWPN